MKKINVLAIALASIAFISCGKDDAPQPEPKKVPISITTENSNEKTFFEYNSENMITKLTEEGSGHKDEYTFFYTSGKVSKILTLSYVNGSPVDSSTYTITHVSDTQILVNSDGEIATLNLDNSGNVTSITSTSSTVTFTYDSKGNLTKVNSNGDETRFTYTSYKGILSGINTPKWAMLLVNELFSLQFVNAASAEISNDYTSTFTYDEASFLNGYPTKVFFNETSSDGTTSGTSIISYK